MKTIAEIAQLLRVSKQVVYALVQSGQLIAHRIGVGRGTIRVTDEDFEAFLNSCRDKPQLKTSSISHLKL